MSYLAMNHTKLLLIRFNNNLPFSKIEAFRGAIIDKLRDKDILFHNHLLDRKGYRYSYPLIQYKRINHKAAILCFDVGTESIGKFFLDSDLNLTLYGKPELFEVDNIKAYKQLIQIWDSKFHYSIRKWLALNQENYEKYSSLESVAEKSVFLEKILCANILSFAKGLNVFFDKQVMCKITQLSEPQTTSYKGTLMTIFDAEFFSNVTIPDYAGLGKGVSIGYGNTTLKKEKINK